MNKKMKALLEEINAKHAAAQAGLDAHDLDAAEKAMDEADGLQREFDLAAKLYGAQKGSAMEAMAGADEPAPAEPEARGMKAFGRAAKARFNLAYSGLSEGTDPAGGYAVPEDVSTEIEHLRCAEASLLDYVSVVNVATDKGSRLFRKRKTASAAAKVAEAGAIAQGSMPEFGRVEYSIEKYADFYPATNELLADSDANIANELAMWVAEVSRATANAHIVSVLESKAPTAVTSLDGIKKAFNVTLGQAFSATAKVFTNDDGLNWLDTLADANGRPLLQAAPDAAMPPTLALGFRRVPLVVLPNGVLPSSGTKVPFFVGDLKEGVAFFERAGYSFASSTTATMGDYNAFGSDLTLFRYIERHAVAARDTEAWVYLTLDTAKATATASSGTQA